MDLRRLRRGEIVAAASALALFVVMFLSWYGTAGVTAQQEKLIAAGGGDTTASAWQSYDVLDFYLLLVVVAALVLALLTATERSPALPVGASVITTVLAALGVLLVLVRILDQPGPNDAVSVKYGAWLGLASTAGILVGALLSLREEASAPVAAEARAAVAALEPRPAPPPAGSSPPAGESSPPPGEATPPPGESTPPPAGPPPSVPPPG
jgi:hypothetical protein